MKKLEGKIALITGGTSGIGLATAQLFRDEGARLVITGQDTDKIAATKKLFSPDDLILQSHAGDLSSISSLMQQIKNQFNQIDTIFLNAALAKMAPFEKVSEADFDSMLAVNLKGVFFTIQQALPLLSSSASIIITTSIANRCGSPNSSVYAASKAALRSLVQTLGLELIPRGIRVNAICPGPISTPMFDRIGLPQDAAVAIKKEIAAKSPIKRLGLPEEVAKVVLFLASDDSSYLVGEEIVIDGGISLDRSVRHDLNRTTASQ